MKAFALTALALALTTLVSTRAHADFTVNTSGHACISSNPSLNIATPSPYGMQLNDFSESLYCPVSWTADPNTAYSISATVYFYSSFPAGTFNCTLNGVNYATDIPSVTATSNAKNSYATLTIPAIPAHVWNNVYIQCGHTSATIYGYSVTFH